MRLLPARLRLHCGAMRFSPTLLETETAHHLQQRCHTLARLHTMHCAALRLLHDMWEVTWRLPRECLRQRRRTGRCEEAAPWKRRSFSEHHMTGAMCLAAQSLGPGPGHTGPSGPLGTFGMRPGLAREAGWSRLQGLKQRRRPGGPPSPRRPESKRQARHLARFSTEARPARSQAPMRRWSGASPDPHDIGPGHSMVTCGVLDWQPERREMKRPDHGAGHGVLCPLLRRQAHTRMLSMLHTCVQSPHYS
jgi:hypothetical protein